MSKKRKRRRRARGASQDGATRVSEPDGEVSPAKPARDDAAKPARRRGLFGPREPVVSPYPPFGVSVARGMRAVGASPVILALGFLGTLGIWGLFTALGAEPSPQVLVNAMAHPPINVYFDVVLLTAFAPEVLPAPLLILLVGLARSVLLAALALLVAGVLRDGVTSLGSMLRRLPRTAITIFLVFSLEVAAIITVPSLVQQIGGPSIALLGILGTLFVVLYFVGMTPSIAAVEGGATAEVLRRSVRAARLPGPRHALLVLAYFSFAFWELFVTPGLLAPATPSVLVWGFALLSTFVHLSVLGALTVRWLAVRDQVPAPAPRTRH